MKGESKEEEREMEKRDCERGTGSGRRENNGKEV